MMNPPGGLSAGPVTGVARLYRLARSGILYR